MAMIRISNKPGGWQDLGPARGRIANSGGIFGGPIIAPSKPSTGMFIRATPKGPYQARPSDVPRCGKPLRNGPYKGEPCHRRRDHRDDGCRSKVAVERDNRRRRTRDFGR
jgi:hypothetical protein